MERLKNFFTPTVPEDIGKVFLGWEFPEVEDRQIGKLQAVGLTILLAGVLIYAVMTSNFLFAMIIVLSVFIIIFQYFRPTAKIRIQLSEDGVLIDEKFYPYKVLQSFWMIYEPPQIKYLYLDFKNGLKKSLPIPLQDINPLKVREILQNFIPEDFEREEVEFDEIFAKMIKYR